MWDTDCRSYHRYLIKKTILFQLTVYIPVLSAGTPKSKKQELQHAKYAKKKNGLNQSIPKELPKNKFQFQYQCQKSMPISILKCRHLD